MSVVPCLAAFQAPTKNRLPTQKTTGVVRTKRAVSIAGRGIGARKGSHSCMVPRNMITLRRMPVANLRVSSRISLARAFSIGSSTVSSRIPRNS